MEYQNQTGCADMASAGDHVYFIRHYGDEISSSAKEDQVDRIRGMRIPDSAHVLFLIQKNKETQ